MTRRSVSRVVVPGATVEYEVAGSAPQATDRAVVFLHNLLTDRSVFAHAQERLAARGRAIAVDARAHGDSQASRGFTTGDLARDLLAVLDAEKVASATIVGISLGAWVAVELALEHPDRVSGLVLMGATPYSAKPRDARESALLGVAARLIGIRPALVRPVLPLLFGRTFREQQPALVAAWEKKLRAFGAINLQRALRAWATRPSLIDSLANVRAPTLVVVGEEDEAHPPAHGEAIAARIPGARLARVRAGHTMTIEQPEATTRLIEEFVSG